mgnify:CR=1 FL=1
MPVNRENWGFFDDGLLDGKMIEGMCKKADNWEECESLNEIVKILSWFGNEKV